MVGEECFPLRPIPGQHGTADTSSLGEVCLDVMEGFDGSNMLEINFKTEGDWVIQDAHFWLGTSINAAPKMIMYLHDDDNSPETSSAPRNGGGNNNGSEDAQYDSNSAASTKTYKMPDARRFPYHTTMENVEDARLHTTTEWNEILDMKPEMTCPTTGNNAEDTLGRRVLSAQAVFAKKGSNNDGVTSRPIFAFAAMNDDEVFGTLESFFIVCPCAPSATEESEAEEIEGEIKEEEVGTNNMLEEMHAGEQIDGVVEQEDEKTTDKVRGEPEEVEAIEAETKEEESSTNNMLSFLDKEEEAKEYDDNNESDDYVDVQEGHIERHRDSQKEEEEDDNEDEVVVSADELELTTSFLVVVPAQRHFRDFLLDEDSLHETESKIEASPGLHLAWHTFVGQLMGDFGVPSVNVTGDSKAAMAAAVASEKGMRRANDNHRQLKGVTIEWIENSPDLFKFLITTPCPTSVLNMLGDKKKHTKRGVDMGSSPKALIRAGGANDQDSVLEATCYKAFGKYKVLHLMDPVTDEVLSDEEQQNQEDAGSARQEVCYDIFHMTRQALSKDKLGQDLPSDVPFLISGGKPESCLPTGFSTHVVRPKGIVRLDLNSKDDADADDSERQMSPLYELHNEDGSWNALRVMELVAYISTSLVMMSLFITVYCYLLPKIDVESRNRVTDDWSEPNMRPQRIVGSRSRGGKVPSKNPEYFPWLE